jgi:hypothetical protein
MVGAGDSRVPTLQELAGAFTAWLIGMVGQGLKEADRKTPTPKCRDHTRQTETLIIG